MGNKPLQNIRMLIDPMPNIVAHSMEEDALGIAAGLADLGDHVEVIG